MRINISAWSIRRPVPAIVLFAVLMLLGTLSFKQLPVTRFPNIDIPLISILITQSGAAPAELETQVTKIVEDSVANITGVKHITSTLTDGTSTTVIEFRLETDTDRALNDVKDAIAKVRGDLPRTIDEPVIERIDVEGQAILTFAATSPGMTLEQLSWHVDDVIKRRLQATKGVGRVERYGGVDREIRVNLDPDKLLAYGISAADVNKQVAATNVDLGSGRGEVGGQEQAIRTLAGARQITALADAKIILAGGREVRLKDLGTVVDGASEQRAFGRLNGQPVVSFSVFRTKGTSELSVSDAVNASLQELQTAYPDIKLTKIDDAVSYTRGNYVAAMEALIEGAVLAVLVVFLFLRNIRATLISAIALPLAAIPTFWAISAMGFSLNLVSLLGITLATGILVDDATVEIENIHRNLGMKKPITRAILDGAQQIAVPAFVSTLAICIVFVPVLMLSGVAKHLFTPLAMAVVFAMLASYFLSRTLVPTMVHFLLRNEAKRGLGAALGSSPWCSTGTPSFSLKPFSAALLLRASRPSGPSSRSRRWKGFRITFGEMPKAKKNENSANTKRKRLAGNLSSNVSTAPPAPLPTVPPWPPEKSPFTSLVTKAVLNQAALKTKNPSMLKKLLSGMR